jgi:hypothetical protein
LQAERGQNLQLRQEKTLLVEHVQELQIASVGRREEEAAARLGG